MLNQTLYNLTQQLQGAIFQGAFQAYQASLDDEGKANQPTPHPLMQIKRGYAESPGWMMVQAQEFHPEPLTVENLVIRATYSSPRLIRALLDLMTSEGWLDRTGEIYSLTAQGHGIAQQGVLRIKNILSHYASLPSAELNRLADLFQTIIDASLTHKDIPSDWCLRYSRRRAPDENASAVEKIVQFCGDFNALRDDAHMSAFGKYNVIGYTWEAFTYVDDANANNAQALVEQLGYRGLARAEWQDVLDQLVMRGWLTLDQDTYQVTERGEAIRKDVEALTDHYFYASWSCLKDEELTELHELMTQAINPTG